MLHRTFAWEIMNRAPERSGPEFINEVFSSLLHDAPSKEIVAVATAAFRRRPDLAESAFAVCEARGIPLEILGHESEAHLLQKTMESDLVLAGLFGVNVGGGSIQLYSADHGTELLSFGTLDLNEHFDLAGPPDDRRVEDCVSWLMGAMPAWNGEFAYLGEERTYLEHFGVPIRDGWCDRQAFERLSFGLATCELAELKARSPFDPGWMTGAVASNCIVLALFSLSTATRFRPLNANIGHAVFL